MEHFLLYNHLSEDNYLEVLEPYIEEGFVELIDWPIPYTTFRHWITEIQSKAYLDGIERLRNQSFWIAILDTDEFLFPTRDATLASLLKRCFESYPCLYANWQMFGTSNVQSIPKGQLLIEQLIKKAPTNHLVNRVGKSIFQPQ